MFVTSFLRKTNETEDKRRQREMLKKQKNEESRKKDRFTLMRYHDYGRKKLLLLKLAMTTLINPSREKTSG